MGREWMRTAAAAEYLGLTPSSLKTLRARGRGPRFRKLDKIVLYARRDLDEWAGRRSAVRETADTLDAPTPPRRRRRNAA
jgi:hypothetical protein